MKRTANSHGNINGVVAKLAMAYFSNPNNTTPPDRILDVMRLLRESMTGEASAPASKETSAPAKSKTKATPAKSVSVKAKPESAPEAKVAAKAEPKAAKTAAPKAKTAKKTVAKATPSPAPKPRATIKPPAPVEASIVAAAPATSITPKERAIHIPDNVALDIAASTIQADGRVPTVEETADERIWPDVDPKTRAKFREIIDREGLHTKKGTGVPIRARKNLISDDRMTVLDPINGRYYSMLKHHLMTAYGISYAELLQMFKLTPALLPITGPAYSASKAAAARSMGLGTPKLKRKDAA